MSEKDFSVWLCRSYRDGLEGYDKNYTKNRNLQRWSIGLLILAILLLFINKGVIMYNKQNQNYIPGSSTEVEKRSFDPGEHNNSYLNDRIPASSTTICLNESSPDAKK